MKGKQGKEIGMSLKELLALPVSMPVTTAGRAFGFGREKSYEMARNKTFPCPVLPLGRALVVIKADLFRALGLNMDGSLREDPPLAVAS